MAGTGLPASPSGSGQAMAPPTAAALEDGPPFSPAHFRAESLAHSKADVAVSVTGIAGPGGGTPQKPVGLVYLAVQRRGTPASVQRFNFGELSRNDIRMASVSEALRLVEEAIL